MHLRCTFGMKMRVKLIGANLNEHKTKLEKYQYIGEKLSG